MRKAELKSFLEDQVSRYNRPDFIPQDPVSIPHAFSLKEDIEISGFLTALIAWGRRDLILKSAERMMNLFGYKPHDFIMRKSHGELKFVHRTFNSIDLSAMIFLLHHIYVNEGGLESMFTKAMKSNDSNAYAGIQKLHDFAENLETFPKRTLKHLPDPSKGASAKRLNMFLRWMVRKDECGVDFGIWNDISSAKLICPLDVHTGRSARKLGLLKRKQDDRKSAEELTKKLRAFDPNDPVKYDFALFGMGVNAGSGK